MPEPELRGVVPKTHVDGFDIAIIRQSGSIFKEEAFKHLCVDYYFEINLTSNGRHTSYPKGEYSPVVITKKTQNCNIQPTSAVPVLLIGPTEKLVAIDVRRNVDNNHVSLVITLSGNSGEHPIQLAIEPLPTMH